MREMAQHEDSVMVLRMPSKFWLMIPWFVEKKNNPTKFEQENQQ